MLPRPGQDTDYTQHALNTVVKAAGAAHTQRTANNPGTHPVELSKNICLDWSEKILKVACRLFMIFADNKHPNSMSTLNLLTIIVFKRLFGKVS